MGDTAPDTFGRYELVEKLAVGGMAELFRARVVGAHGFQKPLVIKRILPHLAKDDEFVSMFIDEAKITATLSHPKIVQVHELGANDDGLFIVMEYVDGMDLLTLLKKCKAEGERLPGALAVHIAHEVLDALDYAHQAHDEADNHLGIVHRDISPGNVMLSWRGDVKLADFGIARARQQQHHTRTGTLKGKYGYMSPEQIVGKPADARSDLFSVGVVLAELLMFRRLFVAPSDLDVLLMVRDVQLDRLDAHGADIDPGLRAVIDTALQRNPADRYPTAGAFRDALGDWLFRAGERVGATRLARFVEDIHQSKSQRARARAGDPGGMEFVNVATLSGTATQARKLEAEEAARVGRALFHADAPPAPGSEFDAEDTGAAEISVDDIPIVFDADADAQGDFELGPAGPTGSARRVGRPTAPASGRARGERDLAPGGARRAATGGSHQVAGGASPGAPPRRAPTVPQIEVPREPADVQGEFEQTSPLALLFWLAGYQLSGLLLVERFGVVKEAYFAHGHPQFVRSNDPDERLGEYLVAQGVITREQLEKALSVLPHFGGRLGDTLVGLKLMKPLDAFRHLSRQVRDKLVDVGSWSEGRYRWYGDRTNPWPTLPLHLDSHEIMGAGASRLDASWVSAWRERVAERSPERTRLVTVDFAAFGLGSRVGWVFDRCDGRSTVRAMLGWFSAHDRMPFLRVLRLLSEIGAVRL